MNEQLPPSNPEPEPKLAGWERLAEETEKVIDVIETAAIKSFDRHVHPTDVIPLPCLEPDPSRLGTLRKRKGVELAVMRAWSDISTRDYKVAIRDKTASDKRPAIMSDPEAGWYAFSIDDTSRIIKMSNSSGADPNVLADYMSRALAELESKKLFGIASKLLGVVVNDLLYNPTTR